MKLVPALVVAALLSTTASASDNYFYSSYETAPFVGQTIGYSLHSDSCGCSTCAPSCAAPVACDSCAPSCAAPCDTCAPSCAAPIACDSCAPSCAAPCDTCCDCCCPEPVCCPCEPEKTCLFDKIMDIERRKNKWLLSLIGR